MTQPAKAGGSGGGGGGSGGGGGEGPSGRGDVCWLLNTPATCQCISGTDLHRQV